jgi:UDP-N-acetylglucosamine--N-acetylmuramyl-(pentapeptide) pyrophosphoryl-undecaprenol N-acetylglucosamine transferase
MIERVVVAGGGTGGHLFPGIAVVEELRRRNPDLEVCFVGTARGIESRVIPELGERLEKLDVSGLVGKAPTDLLKSFVKLPTAGLRAMGILHELDPQLVLGLGGYASGPMLAAATTLAIPTAVLEQNAHLGFTNRMVAPVVGRAYVTFEETAKSFGARARVVGNPVRRSFVETARLLRSDPGALEARARRILVLGGSQGSQALNQIVPEALALAGLAERGVGVTHQTGVAMLDAVRARYSELGIDAEVVPFIDDMARAYASASVVIGRAGATTIAELCAIGRASILVPFPHAAEDHQTRNADALAARGAAVRIAQSELTPERLSSDVIAILSDAELRGRMSSAARELGRPQAAAEIVDDLYAWLGGPPSTLARISSFPPRRDPEPGMAYAQVDFRASRAELRAIGARPSSVPPTARFEPAFPLRVALPS